MTHAIQLTDHELAFITGGASEYEDGKAAGEAAAQAVRNAAAAVANWVSSAFNSYSNSMAFMAANGAYWNM